MAVAALLAAAAALAPAAGAAHRGDTVRTLPAGQILWTADAETGNLSQWYGIQEKHRGRIGVVTAPVREGSYAFRYEIEPGDTNVAGSGSGERAETFMPEGPTRGVEGQSQWWAWSTMFAPGFTSSISDWNFFLQFHTSSQQGQATHLGASGSQLRLAVYGGDHEHPSSRGWVFDTARRDGIWYDFVLHVRWSSNPKVGYIALWENGRQVIPFTHLATLYDHDGVYLKLGYYREAQRNLAVIYDDDIRLGTTYAAVAAGFPPGSWPDQPPY